MEKRPFLPGGYGRIGDIPHGRLRPDWGLKGFNYIYRGRGRGPRRHGRIWRDPPQLLRADYIRSVSPASPPRRPHSATNSRAARAPQRPLIYKKSLACLITFYGRRDLHLLVIYAISAGDRDRPAPVAGVAAFNEFTTGNIITLTLEYGYISRGGVPCD